MKHAFTIAFAFAMAALAAPASAAPNPCALVTSAEAARAMGTSVLPAKPDPSAENTECRYYNTAKDENVVVAVHHDVSSFPDYLLTIKDPRIKRLPQIGPKAILASNTIYMIKRGTYVTIGIAKGMGQENPAFNAPLIKLATLAASRM
jgi:hypothetical protein